MCVYIYIYMYIYNSGKYIITRTCPRTYMNTLTQAGTHTYTHKAQTAFNTGTLKLFMF